MSENWRERKNEQIKGWIWDSLSHNTTTHSDLISSWENCDINLPYLKTGGYEK